MTKRQNGDDVIVRGIAIAYACSGLVRRMNDGDWIKVEDVRTSLRDEVPSAIPDEKYEYHYDHTDCVWYRPEARNRCPVTCAQYRDGWNDAMQYIFRDGKGYRPYRRDVKYEDDQTGSDQVAKRSRNPLPCQWKHKGQGSGEYGNRCTGEDDTEEADTH